jgi:hypothetical protein
MAISRVAQVGAWAVRCLVSGVLISKCQKGTCSHGRRSAFVNDVETGRCLP